MATDAPALDPRIEEVLRDIAADPRAKLFTCDVERMVRGLGSVPVHASLSTAGLTSAERHLLTIGREEVARLLLIAFRERLEVEQDGSFVYSHERMSRSEWQTRASTAMRHGFDGRAEQIKLANRAVSGASMSTGELLEACIHRPDGRSIDRADLLAASQRLADRAATRVYVVVDRAVRQQWKAVTRNLQHYWRCPGGHLESYYAHAWTAVLVENTRMASDWYSAHRQAYKFGLKREVSRSAAYASQINAFTILLRTGERSQILQEARSLAESNRLPEVEQRVLHLLRHRKIEPPIDHARRSMLLVLADSLSGIAKEIANATSR